MGQTEGKDSSGMYRDEPTVKGTSLLLFLLGFCWVFVGVFVGVFFFLVFFCGDSVSFFALLLLHAVVLV